MADAECESCKASTSNFYGIEDPHVSISAFLDQFLVLSLEASEVMTLFGLSDVVAAGKMFQGASPCANGAGRCFIISPDLVVCWLGRTS